MIGEKRNKHEPVEDIISQLERSAVGENLLSTKKARQDAIESETFWKHEEETKRKKTNFKRAFNRVKERAKMLESQEVIDTL